MRRIKYVRAPLSERPETPFEDAEAAWMWYATCQVARADGARNLADMVETARPCEPDDVYRVVKRLYLDRLLSGDHLRTLVRYGLALLRPDPRVEEEKPAARLWDEAMKAMTRDLRDKGIVA